MISEPSNRRSTLAAFAFLAGIVAAPAACTLDLQGKVAGGAGGSGAGSMSTSGGVDVTSASASGGTGGAMGICTPGATRPCYDGAMATEGVGLCAGGKQVCLPDGSDYGACEGQVVPAAESCFTPGDEDCNGTEPKCTGATMAGGPLSGSAQDEVAFALTADAAGNILVGGVAVSSVGGGVTVSDGIGWIAQIAPAGSPPLWARSFHSTGIGSYSVVRGIATDKSKNVFVVGEFKGNIFDGDISLTNAGGNDIFLVKLDPNGKTLEQVAFGDDKDQLATAIAVDAAGNVFVTGTMGGTFTFGGAMLAAKGPQDVFVAKFDGNCAHVWSKNFGDASSNQVGRGVAATPQGDVVVVGSAQGKIDFGNGDLMPGVGDDVFVAKLSAADGTGLWSRRYGGAKDQNAYGVAVGPDGSIVVTGTMLGKCDFGGGELDAGTSADAFVARLFADGSPSWSKNYGSPAEYQAGLGVTIDADKNIVVVGYFKDTLQIAGITLTEKANSNKPDSDLFVAKLSPDGKEGWARSFGDINDQKAWAVTTTANGEVIVGGTFEGGLDFGTPPGQFNSSGYDGFWVRFAP